MISFLKDLIIPDMENFSLDAKNISIEDYNIYEWNIDLNLNSYMARFDEIQLFERNRDIIQNQILEKGNLKLIPII